MHRFRSGGPRHARRGRLAAGWMLLLCSPAVSAQEARIVSSQIEVSANAASLLLELADGEVVAVRFAGGVATLNGDPLGRYEPGGATDRAWRDLLGGVHSLSGPPLAAELADWRPDSGLDDSGLALLARVDEVLDEALEEARPAVAESAAAPAVQEARRDPGTLVGRGADFLRILAAATEGIELADGELRVAEDHTVPAGTTIDGSVLLVDGHLEVRGRVRGTVIVLNGSLTLAGGSRIDGDVRLMDSALEDRGGSVGGRIVSLTNELREREESLRAALRDEILREEQRLRNARESRRPSMFMFRVRQVADMFLGTTVTFLVLGFLTFLLTVFGGHRVRAVVGEVANNPLGSTLAGFAGAYAILPVFILVCAALAVTVVGIPVLLVWIPLFPLALALAGLAGFVGVAENVGKWALRLGSPGWLTWVDGSNTYFVRLLGIGIFLLPLLFGGIVAQIPFVDWVGNVVGVAGVIGWAAALVIGFGAVIITRGGSRGGHWSGGIEDDAFGSDPWPASPALDASETGGGEAAGGGGESGAAGGERTP